MGMISEGKGGGPHGDYSTRLQEDGATVSDKYGGYGRRTGQTSRQLANALFLGVAGSGMVFSYDHTCVTC